MDKQLHLVYRIKYVPQEKKGALVEDAIYTDKRYAETIAWRLNDEEEQKNKGYRPWRVRSINVLEERQDNDIWNTITLC